MAARASSPLSPILNSALSSIASQLWRVGSRRKRIEITAHQLRSTQYLLCRDTSGPCRLSEIVRKALDWSEPYYVPGTDPVRAATSGWGGYLEALCEDANAGLVSLPAEEEKNAA